MSSIGRVFPLTLVLASLPAPAHAGGARIVSASGGPSYPTIQAAVDAAVDGDVVLVGQGTYPAGFTIANKSLWVLSPPKAVVTIEGTITVRDLAADKQVFLGGLAAASNLRLVLQNDAGPVRLQFCDFRQVLGGGPGGCGGQTSEPLPTIVITGCDDVAFYAGEIVGGEGGSAAFVFPPAHGGHGGHALAITNSNVALYGVTATGGAAGDSDDCSGTSFNAAHAGSGCVLDGTLYATGSTFRGGRGTDMIPPPNGCGGPGAVGLQLQANALAYLGPNAYVGGAGGLGQFSCNGAPGARIAGSGTVLEHHSFAQMTFFGVTVHTGAGPFTTSVEGAPGHQALLGTSSALAWRLRPDHQSVRLLAMPILYGNPPPRVPAGGSLSLAFDMPALPATTPFAKYHAQGADRDPSSGFLRYANPLQILLLSRTAGPDCNGNGLNDFVEVIESPVVDGNHNLIPDVCPGG